MVGAAGGGADELDVVGLGALNLDLVARPRAGGDDRSPRIEDNETVVGPEEIEARIDADGLAPTAYLGGSAYNAVAMLASLGSGLRLGMVGVSTDAPDHEGRRHVDRFEELGIADLTRRSAGRPGRCLALTEGSRRRLYTSPEANLGIAELLRGDDQPRRAAVRSRALHLTSLLEDPRQPGSDEVARAVTGFVEDVKRAHPELVLSFDPGRTWVDGLAALPDLGRVYALADLLYVSPDEYAVLSGRPYADRPREAPLPGCRPPGASVIVKRRDEIVVRDVEGVAVARVPCTDRTSAVDPTGAGDAVAAGVLAAHSVGGSIVDGCRLGLWIASHRVSDRGDGGHRHLPAAPAAFPWLSPGSNG